MHTEKKYCITLFNPPGTIGTCRLSLLLGLASLDV